MDKKKLAAAMAAVMTYIKTQEEAAAFAAAPAQSSADPVLQPEMLVQPQVAMPPVNTWGISGRQTQMQANTMMQMRMFK